MSTRAEVAIPQFLIIDHNVIPDQYVTYIVDLWEGDLRDPATSVLRYIGTWRAEDLEKEDGQAFDPDFLAYQNARYGRYPDPKPLLWEQLEDKPVKGGDESARTARNDEELLTDPARAEGYSGHRVKAQQEQYAAFWDAIDRIDAGEDSDDLWNTIDTWRLRYQMLHEK